MKKNSLIKLLIIILGVLIFSLLSANVYDIFFRETKRYSQKERNEIQKILDDLKSQNNNPGIMIGLKNYNVIGHSFSTGDGLVGAGITFNKNMTYSKYGFCDICPITNSYGYFEVSNDTVIITDTICYYFDMANSNDTMYCEELNSDTLFIGLVNNETALSYDQKHDSNFENFLICPCWKIEN